MTPDAAPLPRLPRLALALLFLGSLFLFAFSAHGYLENTDAEITMHAARAWWWRGSPGLVGESRSELLRDGEPTWPAEQAIVRYYIEDPKLPRYGRRGIDGKDYVWFPIGHQALFVPAMALAALCDRLWPDVEQRYRAQHQDPLFHWFFWERFFASFLSPLAGAGTVVSLLILLLSLGSRPRDALIAVAVATLCTQFWPGTRETLSDMPGTFFLCACAAGVARHGAGGERGTLFLAGLLGGLGVLVRYPQALPLCGLGAWALWSCWRGRRLADFAWFVVGGVPAIALLIYANRARFGDAAETGYSGGVGFFSYPLIYGLPLLFIAFGKGMLWFSVPLWSAFAQLGKRVVRARAATWFALLTFLAPLPLFATLHYWAAGQCWGIRYLTPVIALFVAIALALGTPWRTAPRAFWAVAALGFVLSLGGIVTTYIGHQQYAYIAANVEWPGVNGVDNNVNFEPRYSPLHGHWIHAWLAATGRLESGRSADTTEPIFGVKVPEPVAAPRPETIGFNHLWWRYVREVWPDFPSVVVAILLACAGGLCLVLGARALARRSSETLVS
ncbi:MAG: glycosyltransferase family 39 protein [Planctomycetota bacterium]